MATDERQLGDDKRSHHLVFYQNIRGWREAVKPWMEKYSFKKLKIQDALRIIVLNLICLLNLLTLNHFKVSPEAYLKLDHVIGFKLRLILFPPPQKKSLNH